jgi:hypothetical protein
VLLAHVTLRDVSFLGKERILVFSASQRIHSDEEDGKVFASQNTYTMNSENDVNHSHRYLSPSVPK